MEATPEMRRAHKYMVRGKGSDGLTGGSRDDLPDLPDTQIMTVAPESTSTDSSAHPVPTLLLQDLPELRSGLKGKM